jgi:hypothetical protein
MSATLPRLQHGVRKTKRLRGIEHMAESPDFPPRERYEQMRSDAMLTDPDDFWPAWDELTDQARFHLGDDD